MSKRVFFILCILCFSYPSHAVKYFALFDEDRVCSHFMREQANDPINIIRSFKKTSVVIPSLEFKTDEVFNFLFTLKNQAYSQDDYDDLGEENKLFLEGAMQLNQKLGALNKKLEDNPLIFSKLETFKKLGNTLSRDADPLIFDIIEEYKKQSYRRLDKTLAHVRDLAWKEKNRLFMVVFPEAFFNFFQNPSGFGNFIPFFDDTWKKWLIGASQEIRNVVFFTNAVYTDKEQNISNFDKNFQQFVKNSYDQKEILSAHARYNGLSIIPIFNETFIFYKGKELGRYKKQFILDEDIPVVKSFKGESYLHKKRLLYVPGTNDQKLIPDLFTVEICQDHVKLQNKKKTDMLIIQSASIDIVSDLPNIYEGICIHSDIDVNKSNVYRIFNKKMNRIEKNIVKCQDESLTGLIFQIYNLK
jgi:hypothetical protein